MPFLFHVPDGACTSTQLGPALCDFMDTATMMGTECIVEVHTPAVRHAIPAQSFVSYAGALQKSTIPSRWYSDIILNVVGAIIWEYSVVVVCSSYARDAGGRVPRELIGVPQKSRMGFVRVRMIILSHPCKSD